MSPDTAITQPHFSIRTVSRQTGLKSDTIRKWEQRYGAVQPSRTDGNTRRYSASDVERLSLLRSLTELGHPIRELAPLPVPELEALRQRFEEDRALVDGAKAQPAVTGYTALLDRYLGAVHRFDSRQAYDLLSRAAALLDPAVFADQIAVPLLRRIGDEWEAGSASVAHEHLISAQLRSVLNAATVRRQSALGAPRVLLTTPAGHRHEFGLLIAAHLIAARGFEPVSLGVDLPEADLHSAIDLSRADLLVLSILTHPAGRELEQNTILLDRLAAHVPTWVGIPHDHPLSKHGGKARLFHDFKTFDLHLTGIDRAAVSRFTKPNRG